MISDPSKVTDLMRRAAEDIVLPRFESLKSHEIIEKAPGDLVTVADLESEHFLTRELPKLLPDSLVVGEEAHAKNPEILRRFEEPNPIWVIDPVDGTKNFTKGSKTFCMIVALVIGNRPVMGWIHDPLKNVTAFAKKGEGAWLAGERLTVPAPPPESDMVGMLDARFFEEPRPADIRAKAKARFGKLGSLSCAGQDLLAQAKGERHFSFYRRLWPWDHAAGALILREAGGVVERFDGGPYRAGDRVHGLLTAPTLDTWRDIRDFLQDRH